MPRFAIDELGALVRRRGADDPITNAIARLTRVDLVILDDTGMLPAGADAAEGFYRVVDAADEHRSLTVSSNLYPSGFDELMPKALATATVDRLLHHARICLTEGDSFRHSEAAAGKGVKPLPSCSRLLAVPGEQPRPPARRTRDRRWGRTGGR